MNRTKVVLSLNRKLLIRTCYIVDTLPFLELNLGVVGLYVVAGGGLPAKSMNIYIVTNVHEYLSIYI